MDPLSHIVFAFIFTGQPIQQTLPILAGALLPDLDHFLTYAKGRLKGAESRTFLHELPAASILIAGSLLLNSPLFTSALISHYTLDFITGETKPFLPFSDKKIDFNFQLKHKIILGGMLWGYGLISYIPT